MFHHHPDTPQDSEEDFHAIFSSPPMVKQSSSKIREHRMRAYSESVEEEMLRHEPGKVPSFRKYMLSDGPENAKEEEEFSSLMDSTPNSKAPFEM